MGPPLEFVGTENARTSLAVRVVDTQQMQWKPLMLGVQTCKGRTSWSDDLYSTHCKMAFGKNEMSYIIIVIGGTLVKKIPETPMQGGRD